MKTFDDLLQQLKKEDEVTILEILNITPEDLVDNLESYIFDKQEIIWNSYNEDSEELGWEEATN